MIRIKINYNNEFTIPLYLNAGSSCEVTDVTANDNGDLIIMLNDGSSHNLGQLIGKSGIIYKPHIEKDEHNVFTFTIDGGSLDDEPALVCRMGAL